MLPIKLSNFYYMKTAPYSTCNVLIFFLEPLNLIGTDFKIKNSICNNTKFSVTLFFLSFKESETFMYLTGEATSISSH